MKEPIEGFIQINKSIKKYGTNITFKEGEVYKVKVFEVGFKGGFERYPVDNTMEGSVDAACIVEILDYGIMSNGQPAAVGLILCFESNFEVTLSSVNNF